MISSKQSCRKAALLLRPDEIRFAFSDNSELEFHAVYAKGKPRPDNTAFMIVNSGGDNNENQ